MCMGGGLIRVGGIFLCWGLTAGSALAQFSRPDPLTASSRSSQFIVQAVSAAQPASILETNRSLIHLEPTLVAISAERIKRDLWSELETSQPWRGKVFVTLYPATTADDGGVISSERFSDGWQYRVVLPNVVERGRYVRAMTQALLLEMANRSATLRSAEIPTWLVEGLSRQLLASKEMEIILPPPAALGAFSSQVIQTPAGPVFSGIAFTSTFADRRWQDPLDRAHKQLTSYPPLTFQDLSWPTQAQLTDQAGEIYRSSAQLFVDSLLRLNDGRACLRAFLAELPQHYNWQFAFLRAFQTHFTRPLEIEKWWALKVADFTGYDITQTWPSDKSLQKLDEAVCAGIEVRTRPDELPLHAQASLQNIVRDWDPASQTFALQTKLRELEALRPRISRDLFSLLDDYHKVIAAFLENRDKGGFVLGLRRKAAHRHATAAALMQLDALDSQRLALHPARKPASPLAQAPPGTDSAR
ncbi:MAG: hypothetical protein ACLQVX_00285 [Limisphaerales bacterium]